MLFWALRAAFVGNSGIHHRSALSNGVWSRLHIGPLCGLRWTIAVIHVHCNSLRKRTIRRWKVAPSHQHLLNPWCLTAPWPVRVGGGLSGLAPVHETEAKAKPLASTMVGFFAQLPGKGLVEQAEKRNRRKSLHFFWFQMLVSRGVYLKAVYFRGAERKKNMMSPALSWIPFKKKKSCQVSNFLTHPKVDTQLGHGFFAQNLRIPTNIRIWMAQTNGDKNPKGRNFQPTRWFKPWHVLCPIVGGHLTFPKGSRFYNPQKGQKEFARYMELKVDPNTHASPPVGYPY